MKTKFYLPLFLFTLMIACTPATKLENSWADPSLTPGNVKQFKKVLVVAKLKDESTRRIAEDKIAAQVKAPVAVPSYSYLTGDDTDEAQLTAKLKNDGFDGVILMQLKEVEKSTSYTPGTVYAGGWYGGYRGGYGGIYGSPGYYSEDKTYFVESTIFSLTDNKLLWSGVTSSLNPTKLEKTIDEVISTVKLELQNKGFISKPAK
jgi:hypothetical protein